MNKLIKASLFAAAFLFVAGCSTQKTPNAMQDTVSSAHAQVHAKVHPSHLCKGKRHCLDKLGSKEMKDNVK